MSGTTVSDTTPTGTIIQPNAVLAALKSETLVESLPWLQRFHDTIFVFKFGGNAITDSSLLQAFAEDMVYLRYVGIKPVVVHGGGPQISAMLERLGIESEFRGGYRYTSPEAMEVVQMVLTGQITRDIVNKINRFGPLAAGISGEDAGLFAARRITTEIAGEQVDLGLVGEVTEVNPAAVLAQVNAGRIPVVSSIAPDIDDPTQVLNVNADSAAAALAVALGAEKLVILTNVAGLYADWPDRGSLVSQIDAAGLRGMLADIESGMIPKMQACLDAVENGVPQAHVVDGRTPHSSLLEIFTSQGIGTLVTLTVPDPL